MKKSGAILLLLTMALALLTSCAQGTPFETVATTTPTTEPEAPEKEDPAVDTTDYRALAQAALEVVWNADTPAEQFILEPAPGGVKLLGYTGDAAAVCIPSAIGEDAVVAIGADAFAGENCKTLEALVLPSSLTAVDAGCLRGCTALKALHAPFLGASGTQARHLGYLFGADDSSAHAMHVPETLLYVQIDGTGTEIAENAFAECNDIVCILLGDGIKKVGSFAFYNCTELKYVSLHALEQIGSYALGNCRKLVRADFGTALTSAGLGTLQGCSDVSALTLPFVGGSLLENNYLGYLFGAEHPDFTAGYIPAYLRSVTLLDTCTVLGDYAFFECSVIRSVQLPQTLTSIGVRAFEKCTELTAVSLPASLQTVRENAFLGCTALEDVRFSEGLQSLGINCFYGCISLKEIKLPQSLRSLPASVFADCSALEYVDFGGVEQVGKNAFRNCTALKNVVAEDVVLTEGNDPVGALIGTGTAS